MAITFLPSEFLRKTAPEKLVKRLITKKLTVNKAALSMLSQSDILSKKKVLDISLKVAKSYKQTYKDKISEDVPASEALDETLNDKKLVVARVHNAMVHEVAKDIKKTYHGESYEWLPSDADEPDPVHQLNYGLIFQLGKGESPGDRYGCRCGMRILVDDTELGI